MARHRLIGLPSIILIFSFPPPAKTGRKPRDRRMIVDAILWILRTGAPWRDLPLEFGPWATAWDLFNKWNANGTLDKMLNRLRGACMELDEIDDELWCIDGTTVRAARCAAGGGKKGTRKSRLITH